MITGASRGIGKSLLNHYREKKANVIGISTKDCDLSNWKDTSSFLKQEEYKALNLVIHCAAVNKTKFFYKMDYNDFKQMVDSNIIGTFNLLKNVVPILKEKGSVVIFSSAAAFSPRMGQAGYACCKSALHGLIKVLSQEMMVEKKYIYLIAPGIVETGMSINMMSGLALEKAKEVIPMGRFCNIDEIIKTIDFLIDAPYLTGQTLHLNGGYFIP